MASKYWLKLYHEMLHDPKMQRLSDRLFRRTIEMFLFAGDLNAGGVLPSLTDMAWILRVSEEELESDLTDLQGANIVSCADAGWEVTNFAERQSPMSSTERMRRMREDQKKSSIYDNATKKKRSSDGKVTKRHTDIDKDIDKIKIKKKRNAAKAAKTPECVKVFRSKAHRYPPKSWYSTIQEVVGDDPKDLDFWGRVVFAYVGFGWNPTNVSNMLEFYRRREIPRQVGIPGQDEPSVSGAREFLEKLRSGEMDDV